MSKTKQPEQRLKPENFRISASCVTQIMGGNVGMSPAQKKKLTDYEARIKEYNEGNEKKKLTDIMQKEYNDLLILSKKPLELPQGAKTFVEKWVKQFVIYKKIPLFGNKYTRKGDENEDESIDLIAQYFDLGEISKNKERKFSEYMEGECDVELKNFIIDAKNSYTFDTFPIFENEIPNAAYEGQIQVYMYLYGKKFGIICYVLTNASEDVIDKEAKNFAWAMGYEEVTEEIYELIKSTMTYDDCHIDTRIKAFIVPFDQDYIDEVILRVKMCREYAVKLVQDFKTEVKIQKNIIKHATISLSGS